MKTRRHNKILELIGNVPVNTQEELMRLLSKSGFRVTQATVSRDIKDLGLIKIIDRDTGGYKYSVEGQKKEDTALKFMSIFSTSVREIKNVNNMVVLKCYPGLAQGVCAAIDGIASENVAGTIAGDDTIFILTMGIAAAEKLVLEFKGLLND